MRAASLIATVSATLVAACGPGTTEGTCKEHLLAGDLVITEVFADYQGAAGGTGADEGKEWIELYNASGRPVVLEGLTVVHGKPDGSKQKSHTMDDVTIAPDQYFTIGNSGQGLLPAYVDYGYGADLGDLFNTDGGKIQLRCGDQEIDAATYDAVKSGRSRQLTSAQPPDYTLNDDLTNWCEAKDTEFEPGNFGTPGQDNDCRPVVVGQCSDGGTMRDTVGPEEGDLVITEVMPSPTGDDNTQEWFEARVMKDVDLNGVGLERIGDTSAPNVITSDTCIHATAGSFVVFAKSVDPLLNGGLPAAAIKGTFKFAMVAGSAAAPADVQLQLGSAIVDSITWPRSSTGKALQLDPDFIDPTANDNASNFCDATALFGTGVPQDLGTPGAANTQCALLPQPGQCLDNGTPRAIVKPAVGALVITEFLANPAGTGNDATQEWFEIKNTGAAAFDLNGLGLQGTSTAVNVIAAADCKSVAVGAFALFAHNTDPAQNGGLPAVDATFAFALAQTNGKIQVLDGAAVIDAITWTTGIVDGGSKQLQPGMTTATDNDVPANFCNATPAQPYGAAGNLGTPKAVNVCL